MSKSLVTHYKNKYPGGRVDAAEDRLDVYDKNGEHRVSLRRDGNGSLVDRSEENGCKDRHDLSPIPKNTRVHKLNVEDRIVKDEKASERLEVASELVVEGKILSVEEYKKLGCKFDHELNVIPSEEKRESQASIEARMRAKIAAEAKADADAKAAAEANQQ